VKIRLGSAPSRGSGWIGKIRPQMNTDETDLSYQEKSRNKLNFSFVRSVLSVFICGRILRSIRYREMVLTRFDLLPISA
jgi:hypothetical protein